MPPTPRILPPSLRPGVSVQLDKGDLKFIPAETRPFPVPGGVRHAGDEEGWFLYPEGFAGDWVPQLTSSGTQPNLGTTGEAQGRYSMSANWCMADFFMRFGSGGGSDPGTGTYFIEGLPFQIDLAFGIRLPVGKVVLFDDSLADIRTRSLIAINATQVNMRSEGGTLVDNTAPWTWAGEDYFYGSFFYPAVL